MTNLPITSNALPPAANSTASAAAGTVAGEAQFAGPFAALLAQQIGNADAALLNLAQISIAPAEPGATIDTKDVRDPAANIPDAGIASSDAANPVMAMLLQIPQEPRTTASNGISDSTTIPATGNEAAKAGPSIAVPNSGQTPRSNMQQELPAAPSAKTGMTNKPEVTTVLDSRQAASEVQVAARQIELPATVEASQPSLAAASSPVPSPALSGIMPGAQITSQAAVANPQTINTPVGAKGWADEFSQKITWMGTQQNQVAELHLNPPDLGPLDVVLKVTDNQATALFTSPHGAVREAVESALPRLREALADNGIMLGNATVSDQPPRERDAERFAGQGSGTSEQRNGTAGPDTQTTASARVTGAARRHEGMVDTFA